MDGAVQGCPLPDTTNPNSTIDGVAPNGGRDFQLLLAGAIAGRLRATTDLRAGGPISIGAAAAMLQLAPVEEENGFGGAIVKLHDFSRLRLVGDLLP